MKMNCFFKGMAKTIPTVALLAMVLSNNAYAENATDQLDEISVTTVREKLEKAGAVKDVIEKTEVITEKEIQKKGAWTLSEAINNEPGIQSSTGCSMCGMKRMRINGMKGEHTTILVDDVPLHSTVSGYYGLDAQTTAGVQSIEVSRGAGSSLIAPEAIGGVVNIKTKSAEKNSVFIDASGGNAGNQSLSAVATGVSKDGKTRLTVSGQYNAQDQWDEDDNGVNESPALSNLSLSTQLFHDITDKDELSITVNKFHSEVFGGFVTDRKFWAIAGGNDPSVAESFVGGNVNNKYTGGPWGVTEAINTDRLEGIVSWQRMFNDKVNLKITGSGANQIQESMYEGTDYHNEDNTAYGLAKVNILTGESNLLTVGVDSKVEQMDAKSKAFGTTAENGDIIHPDDFDFMSLAGFVQDVWTPNDVVEVSAAVRLDKITTDWVYNTDEENELDELMVAPRLHVRITPIEELAIRVSGGRGYRAPLSFFESEHGLTETGYDIKIDALEDSWGGNASVSYDNDKLTATASYGYTMVNNIATYEDIDGRTTLVNNKETVTAQVADIVAGYTFTDWFTLGASYEFLAYDDEYKSTMSVPAIEHRAKVMLDFELPSGTSLFTTGTFVAGRDLADYGLGGLYNVYDEVAGASEVKETEVPGFFTLDAKLSQKIGKKFAVYVSGKNLTGFTQVGNESSSPLFWDEEGGFDVGYIWGPLRGREFAGGVQVSF